jgi:F420-dependent oxidoreductase-like protein
MMKLTADSLVVLAGPSGSGKSAWAAAMFRPSQVVSSDALRGVVGEHEHDLRASADSFDLLDLVVERRLARGLLTVVDTLGMDPERHEAWLGLAAERGRPTHLVRFDTDAKTCRKRNKARPSPVPSKVLSAQLTTWDEIGDQLGTGFDHVHVGPEAAVVVPRAMVGFESGGDRTASMRFGLQISTFDWPGGNENLAADLARVVGEAERAGFDSVWVMDHFLQIPQVGREWDAMLEAYTTLGFLAAKTERMTVGTMVTCVTHRNIALLGKIIATLDVLSGGRARCGLGVGWYEREHRAYGYRFPPVAERYELLEDAVRFLPLLWGSGSPPFEGTHLSTPEAICYPRPLQAKVPILIGGSGERRTLRLVAEHADACNLFGEPNTIRRKMEVLESHCAALDRDPADIEVTQLSAILSAPDRDALRQRIADLAPSNTSPEDYAERVTAAPAEIHVERFSALANAGVQTAIVSLADVGHPGAVTDFAPVIDALRP